MAEFYPTDLGYLDEEIAKSKNLRKATPIKLIAVGGFVAISYFHNRETTEDLEYIIDPAIKNLAKIEKMLQWAIKRVASAKSYEETWVNDRVSMFAVGNIVLS